MTPTDILWFFVSALVLLVGVVAALEVRGLVRERRLEQRVGTTEAFLKVLPEDTAATASSLATLRQRLEALESRATALASEVDDGQGRAGDTLTALAGVRSDAHTLTERVSLGEQHARQQEEALRAHAQAAVLLLGRVDALESSGRPLRETANAARAGVEQHTGLFREHGERADSLDRRLTFAEGTVSSLTAQLAAMTESVGGAVAGFRGLAVHTGKEHTPDLYVFSRQNRAGVPVETWRCHHCAYRETRDASGTERTDLARPPDPALGPNTPQTPATNATPSAQAPASLPRTVVAQGEGLVDAMKRRT